MNPAAEALCRWLIDYYALATVLLAGVSLGLLVLRQPVRRVHLCRAATAGLMGLAVVTTFQGFVPLTIPVFKTPSTATPILDLPVRNHLESPTTSAVTSPSAVDAPAVRPSDLPIQQVNEKGVSWKTVLACFVWIGFVAVSAWLSLGYLLTARLQRMARPAGEPIQSLLRETWRGAGAPPLVLVSGEINQALAAGVLCPVILLPEWFEERESPDSVRAVLRHEAAHISNRDLGLRAQQRLLMLILFAHPWYWIFRGATQANQEYVADATARGKEPLDYAEILMHWFRTGASGRNKALTATVGLWDRPHLLKRRIAMVLNENFRVERSCPSPLGYVMWSGVLLTVLALSCITLHAPSEAFAQGSKSKSKSKSAAKKSKDPVAKPTAAADDATPEEAKDSAGDAKDKEADQPKFSDEQIAKAKKYASAEEAYGVGAAHHNSRNYAASREPFEAALILDPNTENRIKVYRALMASYRQLGTIDQFVGACEYIIRHSERAAEQSLTRSALLSFVHERGKDDPFIERHEERLKQNPKDRTSVFIMAEFYTRVRENPKRSIELLKQLAELDGKSPDEAVNVRLMAQLASQHIRAKEYQKGAELYEKIAPVDATLAAWHWKEAGAAWLKLKQNDKALAAARKSAEAAPEKRSEQLTHYWHRGLGDIFLATGEAKLAIPQFEQAIARTKNEGYIKDCNASLVEAKKKAGE